MAKKLGLYCVRLGWAPLLISVLAWPCLGFAAPKQVLVVLSEDTALYKEAANAVRDGLENEIATGKLVFRTIVVTETGNLVANAQVDTLLVPLGTKAMNVVEQFDQPILAGLLARQHFERYFNSGVTSHRGQVSAIFLDQPLARQLQLVRALQPQVKSVGVLLGISQLATQPELSTAANAAGLSLISITLNNSTELYSGLQHLLPKVDALLLLPDPLVVNRSSVQNLMLSAYRQRVPTLGYSQSLVDVGALAAVFSTPQQIGKQIAESIQGMLPRKNWELPPPVYPKYFSVKTNASVARSLGVSIPGDATLLQRMGVGAAL